MLRRQRIAIRCAKLEEKLAKLSAEDNALVLEILELIEIPRDVARTLGRIQNTEE